MAYKILLPLFLLFTGVYSQNSSSASIESVQPEKKQETKRPDFLQITENYLQTPVYSLKHKNGHRLKLIGVVHMAEASYYQKILTHTRPLGTVFFEGIYNGEVPKYQPPGSENTAFPKKKLKNMSSYQTEMARKLELSDQIEHLAPEINWVHADISFFEFFANLMNFAIEFQKKEGVNFDLNKYYAAEHVLDEDLSELPAGQRVFIKRQKIAQSIKESVEDICYTAKFSGFRDILIVKRNKIALSKISEKMSTEKEILDIGIVYGAAHVPHFLEVLTNEFNFTIESLEWLDAWILKSN